MIPTYFPFSFLSGRAAAHLEVCFPAIRIYLPVESVKEQIIKCCKRTGFLEIRVLEPGLDRTVEDLYRAAMQWKMATLGADVSFVKAWEEERAPFFDETTISYLRKDILRHGAGARKETDDLAEALLFLRLALDYDLREVELVSGVGVLETKEKQLFEALRGEDDEEDDLSDEVLGRSFAGPAQDPGTRMTGQRLRAWAMVAARDKDISGIFLTDSPAVVEHLQERCPAMAPVAEIGGIPVMDAVTDPAALKNWQDGLSVFLEKLVYGHADENLLPPASFSPGVSGGAEATLSFFTIPDMTPEAFFEIFANQAARNGDTSGEGILKNIVIGQLRIN